MRGLPAHLAEHFLSSRHAGPPPGDDVRAGEARNAACGDHVVIYFALSEGRVAAAGWKAVGCPVAMGTAAAACTVLEGLSADAGLPAAFAARFEAAFGAPAPAHRHAVSLCAEALAVAVAPRAPGA